MKRLTILLLAAIGLLSPIAAKPAYAYYDDVHYALTYYLARQSGYTPLQAYRIASVCSMVDWDPDTEPVQGANQAYLLLTPFKGAAQAPRAKFHAMRDEREHSNVLGGSENGVVAQGGVLRQRESNWQLALATKNPGVFLHAFQDEKPHYGYGTAWGHWPMMPGCVAEYKAAGLPIGGSTDWVSHRTYDVLTLCESTNSWLTKFMDKVSPHQFYRPYYENEFAALVNQLASANKAPRHIDSELKRQLYIQFYAKSAGVPQQIWGNLVDPSELSNISAQLGIGLTQEELLKQKNGPDVPKAIQVVNAALKAAGMQDTVPSHHMRFELDEDGRPVGDGQLDNWVLTGSLQTSIRGGNPVKATLKMQVRDRTGKTKEMDLPGLQPVQMRPGVEQKWPNLPIGDVILELEKEDGSKITQTFTLTKRENVFPAIKVDDEEGIGGHWLWVREGKDEKGKKKIDLVPAYLTPQSSGGFNGVYFPYLTIETLVRTPDQSPTRIKFKRSSGNVFTYTWEYPRGGPKGTGTMTWSGAAMEGTWEEDGSANKGAWKWVRPTTAQEAILKKFFGR